MLADAPWIAGRGALPPSGSATPPFLVDEPADLTMVLSLVAADLGSALIPSSVTTLAPGVAVVPLRKPDLVHRTEVLTLRNAPAAAEALVGHLRQLARGTTDQPAVP
jgi:DNA-binding transcriptional LysR family regulator